MSLKRDLALVSALFDIFLLDITMFFSSSFFFFFSHFFFFFHIQLLCCSYADHPRGLRGRGMG